MNEVLTMKLPQPIYVLAYNWIFFSSQKTFPQYKQNKKKREEKIKKISALF